MNEIKLKSKIATININGETKIIFPDKYNSIAIRTDSEIGISPLPNKNIGDENVLKCKANESTVFSDVYNTYIYLIGTGTVEIILGNNFNFNPFKVVGGSGGGGGTTPILINKMITENGTYNASADNADGYSRVTVDVEASPVLDTKDITENGTYTAADEGLDGFSEVTVDVPEYFLPDAYRQIDYVQCGTGSNQQSGFVLKNLEVTSKHICEMVTITPPYVNTEAGFWGVDGQNVEIYYDSSFELADYGVAELISNSTELTPDGFTKNTTRMKHTGASRFDINIGYYRAGRYPYVGRIYSCKFMLPIVDANGNSTGREKVLIDLVPCVRISDGVVGMFDLVNQVFYQSRTDLDPFTE